MNIGKETEKMDIWITKPAWWLKVWIWLNNHVDENGVGTFISKTVYKECHLYGIKGIRRNTLHSFFDYARRQKLITTESLREHGVIITILNYKKGGN